MTENTTDKTNLNSPQPGETDPTSITNIDHAPKDANMNMTDMTDTTEPATEPTIEQTTPPTQGEAATEPTALTEDATKPTEPTENLAPLPTPPIPPIPSTPPMPTSLASLSEMLPRIKNPDWPLVPIDVSPFLGTPEAPVVLEWQMPKISRVYGIRRAAFDVAFAHQIPYDLAVDVAMMAACHVSPPTGTDESGKPIAAKDFYAKIAGGNHEGLWYTLLFRLGTEFPHLRPGFDNGDLTEEAGEAIKAKAGYAKSMLGRLPGSDMESAEAVDAQGAQALDDDGGALVKPKKPKKDKPRKRHAANVAVDAVHEMVTPVMALAAEGVGAN